MDKGSEVDSQTVVEESQRAYSLVDLLTLMERLRDPVDGCPWDMKQDYKSIVSSTIEEAYEVVDAIEEGDFSHLREELGDLLFQVVFYSQLSREASRFDFSDVVADLTAKLIRRHPHVFPDGTLESRLGVARSQTQDEEIKVRWDALKLSERTAKGQRKVLDDVPLGLPALTRAVKLQKRAAQVGFDWPDVNGVLDKIEEEIAEVREALADGDSVAVQDELGDVFFALTNLCRHQKVDPESAVRSTNKKFERRFSYIESQLAIRGKTPQTASLDEMDRLWDEAKLKERGD